MKTLEPLRKLAYAAHNWTSFSPEKRAESVVNDYSEELDMDIAKIKSYGADEAQVERYKSGYIKKISAWLGSQSNCASSMIAGPANFPVERMRKRNAWADNHYNTFRQWREKVLNAYERYERKAKIERAGGELEVAKAKLKGLEAGRELGKAANKRIKEALRDMVNIDEYLLGLGIKPHMLEYTMKFGFGSCNTNANIRNTKKRIAELEAKEQKAEQGNNEIAFTGGVVLLNVEIDRLQILYNEKPDQETIGKLKGRGFRWSPFYKAWQRQLTRNATFDAQNITGVEISL